jgi:hypothetical protein
LTRVSPPTVSDWKQRNPSTFNSLRSDIPPSYSEPHAVGQPTVSANPPARAT